MKAKGHVQQGHVLSFMVCLLHNPSTCTHIILTKSHTKMHENIWVLRGFTLLSHIGERKRVANLM